MENTNRPNIKISALHIFIIFTVAFLVRWIYINQLHQTYFFSPFKGGFDDYIFDQWARSILKGNWLWDHVLYIYRMPLYPYILSAIYFLFGTDYYSVYIIQALVSAVVCVQVYFLGRFLFDRTSAFLAASIIALYGVLFYYTGMLVGVVWTLILNMSALLLLFSFQKSQKPHKLFLSGFLIGLSILSRGNMLFFIPFLFYWLWKMYGKKTLNTFIKYSVVLGIGIALSVAPVIIRNYRYEHDFVPITAIGGINFYIGNAYGADGRFYAPREISSNPEFLIKSSIEVAEKNMGKKLKPSQVSSYWMKRTIASVFEHGPINIVPLMFRKCILLLNSYEIPDIWDYYFVKQYIPILKLPFIAFSFILPFSALGIYASRKRWQELYLLYGFLICYVISLLVFFISSRYRIQMAPILSIFAGYGIVALIKIIKERLSNAVVPSLVVVSVILLSNISVEKTTFATSHNSFAILLKRDGRIEDAIKEYNKAIETDPNYPSPYYNLGILFRDIGQYGKALTYLKKTRDLDPYHPRINEKIEEVLRMSSGGQ